MYRAKWINNAIAFFTHNTSSDYQEVKQSVRLLFQIRERESHSMTQLSFFALIKPIAVWKRMTVLVCITDTTYWYLRLLLHSVAVIFNTLSLIRTLLAKSWIDSWFNLMFDLLVLSFVRYSFLHPYHMVL